MDRWVQISVGLSKWCHTVRTCWLPMFTQVIKMEISTSHTHTHTPTHVIRKTNNTDASKPKTGYLHIGEWMWRIANGTDEHTREEINWEKGPIMAILIKNPLTTITVYARTHTHTHPPKHGMIPLHLYIWWWTSYQHMCCCILHMRVSVVVWVNAWKSQSQNKDFWYEFNDFLNFMETEKLCCCWYNRLIDTAFFSLDFMIRFVCLSVVMWGLTSFDWLLTTSVPAKSDEGLLTK